jgi:hypothetical protein
MKNLAEKFIQDFLDVSDWEYQISILKKIRSGSEKENNEKNIIQIMEEKKNSPGILQQTGEKFKLPSKRPKAKMESQTKNISLKNLYIQTSEVKQQERLLF